MDINKQERQKAAQQAEHIIAEETLKFQDWLHTLDVVPTIIALRQKAEDIRLEQIHKTFAQLPDMDDKTRQAVGILTQSIVKRMLHDPILFLKKKGERNSKQMYLDLAQQLFNLADAAGPSESGSLDLPED